jgi:hypothetical protein
VTDHNGIIREDNEIITEDSGIMADHKGMDILMIFGITVRIEIGTGVRLMPEICRQDRSQRTLAIVSVWLLGEDAPILICVFWQD